MKVRVSSKHNKVLISFIILSLVCCIKQKKKNEKKKAHDFKKRNIRVKIE